jgi:hypothetical protein
MNHLETSQAADQVADSWTLLYGGQERAVGSTWEGLEAALAAIPQRAGAPNAIVTLVAPNGNTLSIGIAGQGDGDNPDLQKPLASVEFDLASQNPPYLVVVGDSSLTYENGGVLVFRFEGEWTEHLRRNCVSVDIMLRIVEHFVQTGERPDWIPWEPV